MSERARVLALVAEGKVSIEQAEELLDALERRGERPGAQTPVPPVAPVAPAAPAAPAAPVPPVAPAPPAAGRRGKRSKGSFETMIELAVHGIQPSFVKQLREAGLRDLTTDEVVELGIHGVDPAWVKGVIESGYAKDVSVEELVELRIHGVDPKTLAEWREAGLRDLDAVTRSEDQM